MPRSSLRGRVVGSITRSKWGRHASLPGPTLMMIELVCQGGGTARRGVCVSQALMGLPFSPLGKERRGGGGGFDLLFLVIRVFDGVNGLLFLICSF